MTPRTTGAKNFICLNAIPDANQKLLTERHLLLAADSINAKLSNITTHMATSNTSDNLTSHYPSQNPHLYTYCMWIKEQS